MMNKLSDHKYIKAMLAGFGAAALSICFFFVIYRFGVLRSAVSGFVAILRPFIIGAVIAYMLSPVCNKLDAFYGKILHRKRGKTVAGLSVFTSMVLFALALYLLMILVLPDVISSITVIVNAAPEKIQALSEKLSEALSSRPALQEYVNEAYDRIYEDAYTWVNENILPNISGIALDFGSGLLNVVLSIKDCIIGIVVAVYILCERKLFARQADMVLRAVFKPVHADAIYKEVKYADRMFYSFFSGKVADSFIIGVLCYIFCLISGMPNSLLLALIIGVTNIIPFFGPFIGAIPSILLIVIDSPYKALIFAVFIVILQQVDGNIIGPKILGSSTGLSSFWILFAIILFGGLFGVPGMIAGVPTFAVIYDILRTLIHKGYDKHLGS